MCSDTSRVPSNVTLAFFRTKKTDNRMIAELKMYGRIEITRLDFKSVTTA